MFYVFSFDTRWGASVWYELREEKLSQQSVAEIGCRGTWKNDLEEFFPASHTGGIHSHSGGWGEDGFLEFLGRVKEAIDIIQRAQANAVLKKTKDFPRRAEPTASSTGSSPWTGEDEFNS